MIIKAVEFPENPTFREKIPIKAILYDNNVLQSCLICYRINHESWHQANMIKSQTCYSFSVGPYTVGTEITFYLVVRKTIYESMVRYDNDGQYYHCSVVKENLLPMTDAVDSLYSQNSPMILQIITVGVFLGIIITLLPKITFYITSHKNK